MKEKYTLIDGKQISENIQKKLRSKIEKFSHIKRAPSMALISVGNNPASAIYLRNKEKASQAVGIVPHRIHYEENISTEDLLEKILTFNQDPLIDGILVQLPLPKHIDIQTIMTSISPLKDIDGFHPYNVGQLWLGNTPYFYPCTAIGIYTLLEEYNLPLKGKKVAIINRSNIVGKPLCALLSQNTPWGNATVTMCHSLTKNIAEITKQSDVIITAVGQANFITQNMVKKGSIIFDVGIAKNHEGKTVGDVDFINTAPQCSYISPVPYGVGPMTVAMLLQNTLFAFERQNS